MLKKAGVDFVSLPADIDEEKILKKMQSDGQSMENIALELAQQKAIVVSKNNPDAYIIGSDQILSIDGEIYSKAKDKNEAKERLLDFQGRTHFLISAVCVVKDGQVIWNYSDTASLQMRSLTGQDIDKYIELAGHVVTDCVGCYALEGIGIRLFSDIKGDFFTILGMPLLPLLNFLQEKEVLP